ncbi:MAG: ZIP family metal transporter, partial [Opitutales bacterium]|nr:ZIP family metal transporter [Opitutales bacterium]
IGAFCAGIIDYFLPEHPGAGGGGPRGRAAPGEKGLKGAFMAAAALAAHNFPEGFAVFAAARENPASGLGVVVAIALHNIPEGAAVALPAYLASGSGAKAFLLALFAALAEPLGAAAAYLALPCGAGAPAAQGSLALAAGIMVYLSLDELLPSAREYGGGRCGIAGAFCGMAFMAAADLFFRIS